MHDTGMTAETLRDCLLNLPPLELLGMKLLHRQPITTFLTFANADDLLIQSKFINRHELAVYLNDDE